MKKPQARRSDVLTANLDDEVVVYDPERKKAHTLNRLALEVWNHADGTKSIADLQQLVSGALHTRVDRAVVLLALQKLEGAHLLVKKLDTASRLTRREILAKGGKSALVTPLVVSALVPVAAAAQSPKLCLTGTPCYPDVCATAPNGTICYCLETTEGVGDCGGNYTCTIPCTSSLDCPTGWTCRINTCCGGSNGFCGPPCGAGLAPTHRVEGPTQATQSL
jgi:hypothetical protein